MYHGNECIMDTLKHIKNKSQSEYVLNYLLCDV